MTVTHLLYLPKYGFWLEVEKTKDGWCFRNGRDAALWLLR